MYTIEACYQGGIKRVINDVSGFSYYDRKGNFVNIPCAKDGKEIPAGLVILEPGGELWVIKDTETTTLYPDGLQMLTVKDQ